VKTLLRMILGVIAELIVPFLAHLRVARLNDPSVIEQVDRIVGLYARRPDLTGEQKRAAAIADLKAWGLEVARDVKDSVAATLIELGVQRLKAGA
jgi:hypothetical protein